MIDIREHGGSFGGGSKKPFYKHNVKSIPVFHRYQGNTGTYDDGMQQGNSFHRLPVKKVDGTYWSVLYKDYNTMCERIWGPDFEPISDGSNLDYNVWQSHFYSPIASYKYNKLIFASNINGNSALYMKDLDSGLNQVSTIMTSSGGSVWATLVMDEDKDVIYAFQGNSIHKYPISTFIQNKAPIETINGSPFSVAAALLIDSGRKLVLFSSTNANTSYGARVIDLVTKQVIATNYNAYCFGQGLVTDGTYLYALEGAVIKKYDLNLTLISTGPDLMADGRTNLNKLNVAPYMIAKDGLVEDKILMASKYSLFFVGKDTLGFHSEYNLFEPAMVPTGASAMIANKMNESIPYYDREILWYSVNTSFYGSNGTEYRTNRFIVNKLKY